jgi:multidrug efflux pump subunit AcrB
MTLGNWTQAHRRSILFLLAMLALAGLAAAFRLPVSLFPTVDFPRVVVSIDAGDQPAEQMEMLVTRPVEEAVRRVPGVLNVRSTTTRGSAEVSINFDWGRDMAAATLQVNAAIAQVQGTLPPATQVLTRRMDPTVFPIIAYSLVSHTLSPVRLRDLAEYQLRPALSSIDGVSRVQVQGGAIEEYRVTVDPARLAAFGLALDDVAKSVSSANVISAVGRLEDHYKLYLAVSDARLDSLQRLRGLVLRNSAGAVVRLVDVASIDTSAAPNWTRVTADGRDAVLFSVYQQPGSNSVQIATDVKARLDALRVQLPPGVQIASWYDQSELG